MKALISSTEKTAPSLQDSPFRRAYVSHVSPLVTLHESQDEKHMISSRSAAASVAMSEYNMYYLNMRLDLDFLQHKRKVFN